MAAGKQLRISETPIPGFLKIDLPVHADNRGWFKENWQREKLVALGLPDFGPVQNNISFNDEVGVTRGIHAEPWDKYISVATGRVFGAWVDLREGPTFGATFTCEIDPSVAVFVPKGVGNAYQTLEPNTAYTYLVNAHWSPDAKYTFLNLADETAAIEWPIPLEQAIRSDKDLVHPRLAEVAPFAAPANGRRRVVVTGANGQLGRELLRQLPAAGYDVTGLQRADLDITDAHAVFGFDWSEVDIIINAAAWTNVDGAENAEGRRAAWLANGVGPAHLAKVALAHDVTLVHISSEYIFDGTQGPHTEDESPSPLGVYGQSKAAGDLAVSVAPKHYIVRTSWVIGDGSNFVRTMSSLAERGIDPKVVDDQVGRLTFTEDLAAGIIHLIDNDAEYGVYNLTSAGEPMSWYQIAADVFERDGYDQARVSPISTAEYFADKQAAPRPLDSRLALDKIESTGFKAGDAAHRLADLA